MAPLTRVSSPVLAARRAELSALEAAVRNPPVVAVVEGEAGVGKTRLVAELAARLGTGERAVLVGHCHPLHDPFPLGPVLEALRSVGDTVAALPLSPLAGALAPVFPELAGRLPPAPDPLGDARMERHRLWRAVVEVLGAVGPAVLVLEDLHWSDDATPQFVTYLAAHQPPGLAVVLTARAEDPTTVSPLGAVAAHLPASTQVVRIDLGPLGPGDVKVMVGAILDTEAVSDEFAAYLHQRTAGIPLAVEEVLRLLVDRKDIVRRRGRWARRVVDQLEVPAAIRDSMLARVGALAPDARAVVEAAAVVAETLGENQLAAVAGLGRTRTAAGIGAAVAAGILQVNGSGYACRHALAAQAVYEAVAPPRRRRLHHRAAEALESFRESEGRGLGPRLAVQLAHHWREAGDTARWVRWAEEAANLAATLGDPGTAMASLLDVVAAPGLDGPTRGRLALSLVAAAAESLGHADAIGAVQRVLATEDLPPLLRGQIRAGLGALLHQAGDATAARSHFEQAVPDLEESPPLLAEVLTALALPWVAEGTVDQHRRWLDQAGRVAAQLDDPELLATLQGDRATALLALGDGTGWAAIPPAPGPEASVLRLDDRVRLCANVAINAYHLGHDRRATGFVAEGLRISERTGYLRLGPALHATRIQLEWEAGRWDGLEGAAQEVLDRQPDIPSLAQVTTLLARLAAARGRDEEAERLASDGGDLALRCGAIPTLGMAAAVTARLQLARGDPGAARAHAVPVLDIVAAKGTWVWAWAIAPVAMRALIACGAPDEAARRGRRFSDGLRRTDAPAARAALWACRGILAEAREGRPGAAAQFARAEAAWSRIGRPYDEAIAAEARARSLLGLPNDGAPGGGAPGGAAAPAGRADGEAAAEHALATFRRLGAAWDEARVVRLLREHDVAVPYRGRTGRRGYGEELSPREREVVDLAAGGLSSSRIAARLYLSPRTVDNHLARALGKLGLASRRELVAARDAASRPGKL